MSLDELLKQIQAQQGGTAKPTGMGAGLQQIPNAQPGEDGLAPISDTNALQQLVSGVAPPDQMGPPAPAPQGQGGASGLQALLGGAVPAPSGVGGPNAQYGTAGPYNPNSDSFTPEQMAQFQKNAAALPAAPSGNFNFGVDPGTLVDQGGKKMQIPSGGVPGAAGGMGAGAPPAAMLAKMAAMGGPASLGAPATLNPVTATNDQGSPFISGSGAPASPSNSDLLSYLASQNRTIDAKTGQENTPKDKFAMMPGGNMMPVNDPRQEAAANLTFAQQQAGNDPRAFAALMQSMADTGNEKFRSEEAAKQRGGAMDIAKEQSRAHIEGARITAGEHENVEDRQIDAMVATGKMSPQLAQAMKDENAKKKGRGVEVSGGDGGKKSVAEVKAGETRTSELRQPFTTLDANGRPVIGAPTPKMIHELTDKLDAKDIPEVAAAIKRGDYGEKSVLVKALATAAGQNYLMDQGVPNVPEDNQDPNNPGSGIPGQIDTGLFKLQRKPAGTMIGRAAENYTKRTTGSPYTHIEIPGYGTSPFDTTDLHGISAAGQTLGLGKNDKLAAKTRLDKQSLLLDALLNGK